mgnify:CR=1 FL=1|tara:strand:- start:2974 stop:3369 length:396 start_codon:yes stop_codon:yes gene_type:complete
MSENRQAYKEGLVARDRHEHLLPYPTNTTQAIYWLRGLNGMQYKNQKEGELQHQVDLLKVKLERAKDKSVTTYDTFLNARMDSLTRELSVMTLERDRYRDASIDLQRVIDRLALQISREKKNQKRAGRRTA